MPGRLDYVPESPDPMSGMPTSLHILFSSIVQKQVTWLQAMSERPDFIHGGMEFMPGRAESMFVKSMQLPMPRSFTCTLRDTCTGTSFIPEGKRKKRPIPCLQGQIP